MRAVIDRWSDRLAGIALAAGVPQQRVAGVAVERLGASVLDHDQRPERGGAGQPTAPGGSNPVERSPRPKRPIIDAAINPSSATRTIRTKRVVRAMALEGPITGLASALTRALAVRLGAGGRDERGTG